MTAARWPARSDPANSQFFLPKVMGRMLFSTSGFGGAILAIGTDIRLVRTLFSGNQARVGGAVCSWGQPVKNNIWSTQANANTSTALSLSRVRFRQNTAQFGGGAVAWSGAIVGDSALFAQNHADAGAAIAHWSAIKLPPHFQSAFSELIAMTTELPQSLGLARGVFVENQARAEAPAILGGAAKVALGNALMVRNTLSAQSGQAATIEGDDLELANSSIVDNATGGIKLPTTGQQARVVNM